MARRSETTIQDVLREAIALKAQQAKMGVHDPGEIARRLVDFGHKHGLKVSARIDEFPELTFDSPVHKGKVFLDPADDAWKSSPLV